MMEFTIQNRAKRLRLDKFLTENLKLSRSQIQKKIKSGFVLVNGKTAKVHEFLKTNDRIQVSEIIPPRPQPKALPATKTFKARLKALFRTKKLKPKIIFRTKDYLVIEKPAGLLVHAVDKSTDNTLVDWLIKKFPQTRQLEDAVPQRKGLNTPYRPGIIHRLDRDVSGLMVVPLNLTTFEHLKAQFKHRQVRKEYLALVQGALPPQDSGVLEFEISRSKAGNRMAAHPRGSGKGKKAITEFTVLQRFQKYTYVKINLLTGRTNQIRVHFFAYGYPVVGDKIYKLKTAGSSKFNLTRPFLHASQLSFTDLSGRRQTFNSPLPTELQATFKKLKA